MDDKTQEKIQQLQMIEQGMQSFLMQKQQIQTQLIEVESALKELETTEECYKIVGNIMVKTKKEILKKDLTAKKEILDLRIKTVEKQEKEMKDKAETMQNEVMAKLQK